MCRDWRKYSSDLLHVKLASVDWDFGIENVQDFWNVFENKLIKIIDELVPLTQFDGNIIKDKIPKLIKNKINKRNRLLKAYKLNPTLTMKNRVSNLNFEIRSHFFYKKKFAVRKGILPGNTSSLWKAVKIAKNVGYTVIPNNMTMNNVLVSGVNIAEHFAEFFDSKVGNIVLNLIPNSNLTMFHNEWF